MIRKIIKLNCGQYPHDVKIYFNEDFSKLDLSKQMSAGYTVHSLVDSRIYTRKGLTVKELTSLLIHEFVHIALYVHDKIGLDPMSGNGESAAYLMDHLISQVSKKIKCKLFI